MSTIVNMLLFYRYKCSMFQLTAMNILVGPSLLNNIVAAILNNIVGPTMLLTHDNNVVETMLNNIVGPTMLLTHGNNIVEAVLNNIVGPTMLLTHDTNVVQSLFRQRRISSVTYS